MKEKSTFKNVSIKAGLAKEIGGFIEHSKRYRSVAEFVSEACRLRLEQLEKEESKVA